MGYLYIRVINRDTGKTPRKRSQAVCQHCMFRVNLKLVFPEAGSEPPARGYHDHHDAYRPGGPPAGPGLGPSLSLADSSRAGPPPGRRGRRLWEEHAGRECASESVSVWRRGKGEARAEGGVSSESVSESESAAAAAAQAASDSEGGSDETSLTWRPWRDGPGGVSCHYSSGIDSGLVMVLSLTGTQAVPARKPLALAVWPGQ
jgi:hypothetical protein